MTRNIEISFQFHPKYGDYQGLMEHKCIDDKWTWAIHYFQSEELETNDVPPYDVFTCPKCSKVIHLDVVRAQFFLQKLQYWKKGLSMEKAAMKHPDLDDIKNGRILSDN